MEVLGDGIGEGSSQDALKDRQQLIWPILVGSQYIEDLHGPPKILHTYYIPLES